MQIKNILSLLAIFSVAVFSEAANAEPSPYEVKGKYPVQSGVYVAPKVIYSMQTIERKQDDDDSVFGGGLAVGYNFNSPKAMFPMRLEAEYIMRETAKVEIDGISQNYGIDTFMLNGAIGINTGTKLTPYLTGGIGYAFLDGKTVTSGVKYRGDNTDLAWSIGADLTYSINKNVLLGLEYRYMNYGTNEIKTATSNGADLTGQELLFAVRYKF